MQRRQLISVLAVCLTCFVVSSAQTMPYKFDIGASLGVSGYIGDANTSSILKHPGFVGEARFGYIYDARWSFRGLLSTLSLSGSTADMEDLLPSINDGAIDFKSSVYDLGARVEFNFLPYGIGETYKRLKRLTPYVTAGIGVCMSSSGGETAVAPNLPLGMGLKFKAAERVNIFAEFTMTKVFGDKVDGPLLNDLNTIKTSFYKNTDWYSRLSIGFTYEFGKRCETCHYVE